MDERHQKMLEVLQHNKGFIHPERWIDYGLRHGFRKIHAEVLRECPDCGCSSLNAIGQYVYYSTLVMLQECARCGLLFSDKRIDPKVIQSHFEHAYKDEAYFRNSRRRIFEQISALADSVAKPGGKVLDIGGAKGHLLATLRKRRPDLHFVLNDLSEEACKYAAQTFGFQTLCGGFNALQASSTRYDVIILSDVMSLEPELEKGWTAVANLLERNGVVIIRAQNKNTLIGLWQFIFRAVRSRAVSEMQNHMMFFNPEHLYAFSRRYLLARLRGLGFVQVTALPTELLVMSQNDFWHRTFFALCKMISVLSFDRWILTPSLLLIAKRIDRDNDVR